MVQTSRGNFINVHVHVIDNTIQSLVSAKLFKDCHHATPQYKGVKAED